ncbi:hypothetical protein [Roseicyclus elongatus]|uniref:hypothetical protein n=1 Tax=Roseicyclus elongatus TaxID=159346 RepID=UPI00046C8F79|nr:hypothetical protein [Roseibacterium elongatum]
MSEDQMEAPDDMAALEMDAAADHSEVESAETPDVFLASVSETLKAWADVDADLASILSDHSLSVTPHANAVANATVAIFAIAAKRAAPADEQVDG